MNSHHLSRAAALLALALPVLAGAQIRTADADTRLQRDVNPDVLTFRAGVGLEHHSNMFALRDGVEPTQATYGGSGRSDTQFRGLFGVGFDKQVSLQRFQLNAQIEPVKFMEFSRFDHVAYDAGANWDWAVGRPWFGTLGLKLSQRLSGFDTVTVNDKNEETRNTYYATAGFRLTPDFAVIGGIDLATARNSLTALDVYDYDFKSYEAGVRYARGRQAEFDLVWRHTDGDYPNRQLIDASGNVLSSPLDNTFKQDAALLRVNYRPSNDSRFGGTIGYTSRKYDADASRDFSGVTAALNLDWAPSGAFRMRTELAHEIQPENLLVANHTTRTSIALRPSLQLTGRITLDGTLVYQQVKYEGDPTAPGQAVRKDDVTMYGLDAAYQYSRAITARAGVLQVGRSSNISAFDYDDTRLMLQLQAQF